MDFHIVVLSGDGIGPDVVGAAALVLKTGADRFGHRFELTSRPVGGVAIDAQAQPVRRK